MHRTILILFLAIPLGLCAQEDSVEVSWIAHYESGVASGIDRATAVAVDAAGYVYVTGRSHISEGGSDYVTVKYSSGGTEAWVARYDGPDSLSDEATAIAVDAVGYVYVTGRSEGSEGGSDYTTIKYNSDGSEVWVVRYNGLGSGYDDPTSLEVDDVGNIYVTGRSDGIDHNFNYATIKYSPDGTEAWVALYDGPGNGDDWATSLTVDDAGNVYVTGRSTGSGSSRDYATIKYLPDGTESWVTRYDGGGRRDDPAAMTVDGEGNIYVTGVRRVGLDQTDYATIKYNPNGTQLWIAIYDGGNNYNDDATALGIDDVGNVYVTGHSRSHTEASDYTTIKYSPGGTQLWIAHYDGPTNGGGCPYALKVDAFGDILVTGWSADSSHSTYDFATIKYTPSGSVVWVNRYDGARYARSTAMAVDQAGNIYVSGESPGESTKSDYATIRYDSDGTQAWVARYDGPANPDDTAIEMAIDYERNIYVTGWSAVLGVHQEYVTLKYTQDGSQAWVANYPGGPPSAMTMDDVGNIFVTGMDGRGSYATVKYDQQGSEVWDAFYSGSSMESLFCSYKATALAVDSAGNLYVTGESRACFNNYVTIKYNSDGSEAWLNHYDGPDSLSNGATAIAVHNGNAYVTGWSETLDGGRDYATIKYLPDGTEAWVARFNGPGNGDDLPSALAVDDAGNLYVTGYSEASEGDRDYATIKYLPDGTEAWVILYDGPGNGDDWPTALVVDVYGNIYVTGGSEGIDGHLDYSTIKYTPDGTEAWVTRYNRLGESRDEAVAIALDTAGFIYVTGSTQQMDYNCDYTTIRYNPDGSESWVIQYDGEGESWDEVVDLVVDVEGCVYVTGTSDGGESVFTTIKYSQPGYVVSVYDPAKPSKLSLDQNYPNPFNPTTTINYSLSEQSAINLIVFDIQGKEVIRLHDTERPPGNYEVQWNGLDGQGNPVSTGVYFCRIQAGSYSKTIKMLYLR
jgi:uncharacterized delta-60 repeat protein